MTRKSPARVKAIKTDEPQFEQKELPPIEETFDNIKQVFIAKVETSIILAKRIDNLMNIRDYAYKFWGGKLDEMYLPGEKLAYLMDLRAASIETHEQILEIVKTFSLEEFEKEEMIDYFEDIMPDCESIGSEKQLCEAGLVFLTVKPWGEQMTAMHHTIIDEINQRKAIEEMND